MDVYTEITRATSAGEGSKRETDAESGTRADRLSQIRSSCLNESTSGSRCVSAVPNCNSLAVWWHLRDSLDGAQCVINTRCFRNRGTIGQCVILRDST